MDNISSAKEMHMNVGKNKQVSIPMLNIPTVERDTSNIVSRSTRRIESQNKSSVSTSNRLNLLTSDNRYSLYTRSRDNSIKERKTSTRNEGNLSYLDDYEATFFSKKGINEFIVIFLFIFKPETGKARSKIRELAYRMGEYFLAIDLGCLLENKRKSQMDEVAKFTGHQTEIEEIESVLYNSKVNEDMKNDPSQAEALLTNIKKIVNFIFLIFRMKKKLMSKD